MLGENDDDETLKHILEQNVESSWRVDISGTVRYQVSVWRDVQRQFLKELWKKVGTRSILESSFNELIQISSLKDDFIFEKMKSRVH